MMVLVVGAGGAMGRLLVDQLLVDQLFNRGEAVRAIVRSPERLPELLRDGDNLTVVYANVLALSAAEVSQQVVGCRAIAFCLGHNLTFKGTFGQPRQLVTDATR